MADFETTARVVLQKLCGGARLRRCGAVYLVYGTRSHKQTYATPFVAAMTAHGWLAEEDGAFVITEAGRSWLAEDGTGPVLETRLVKDARGHDCFVVANAAESPLALLRRRGQVAAVQFEAGERLRRDFTFARLGQRMTGTYDAPIVRGGRRGDVAETALAARQRFNHALAAVGPGLSDLLFDVCCFLKPIETCERERQWPRATVRVVLCIALDCLAAHYGMRPARRAQMRSWKEGSP
jgi:hypothetical protein